MSDCNEQRQKFVSEILQEIGERILLEEARIESLNADLRRDKKMTAIALARLGDRGLLENLRMQNRLEFRRGNSKELDPVVFDAFLDVPEEEYRTHP